MGYWWWKEPTLCFESIKSDKSAHKVSYIASIDWGFSKTFLEKSVGSKYASTSGKYILTYEVIAKVHRELYILAI